jgi:hypothetical protein
MRTIAAMMAVLLTLGALPWTVQAEDGTKHPVFLMCPHRKKYSAWSVYVVSDKADPSKLVSLGLEKLSGANSEDTDWDTVVKAQNDANAPREALGTLPVAEFGKGKIEIEKNDALKLTAEDAGNGTYKLVISMRCTLDKRFEVGGKNAKEHEVLLKYDAASKSWQGIATKLTDNEGRQVAPAGGVQIQGINFPVTGTGIYRIVGVLKGGETVLLKDGWQKPQE